MRKIHQYGLGYHHKTKFLKNLQMLTLNFCAFLMAEHYQTAPGQALIHELALAL
jgi:hypothetical protein